MDKIYLFTALYPEARPLISRLSLKQINRKGSLRQFSNADGTILLTVTGSGPVAAAFAAGAVLAEENAHAVLYGSAAFDGSSEGKRENDFREKLFLGVKLWNSDSERCFYPDPVGRLLCTPAEIRTGSRVWRSASGSESSGTRKPWSETQEITETQEIAEVRGIAEEQAESALLPVLHDMEAAAFYEAAAHILGPDRIHILKFCSDEGEYTDQLSPGEDTDLPVPGKHIDQLTPKRMEELSEGHANAVLRFLSLLDYFTPAPAATITMDESHDPISTITADGSHAPIPTIITDESHDLISTITAGKSHDPISTITAEELHASVTMENEWNQLRHYGELTGFSFAEEKKLLLQEGLLPVRDKRAGARVLSRIREDILNAYDTEDLKQGTADEKTAENHTRKTAERRTEKTVERRIEESAAKTADDVIEETISSEEGKLLKNKYSTAQVVYVERPILKCRQTQEILSHFRDPLVIPIHHYKDIFNRRRQNALWQHGERMLVLAEKKGQLIYPGAPVCQSFGNAHFYYTSCVMNCLYDCEYCYLHGMYPSGIPVIFTNLDDTFRELEQLLRKHPVYISVSYDTDLMAVENLTGYVKRWIDFTADHPDLRIEIRTKCGRRDLFSKYKPCSRVIFAYTISPEPVVRNYEHQTSSIKERLKAANYAMDLGFTVRLCFDPMIAVPGWKKIYREMLKEVRHSVDLSRILDASIGSFRISGSYLKPMRKMLPDSAVVQYPFDLTNGYYHYPDQIEREMEGFLLEELKKDLPEEKIFLWREME